MNKELNNTSFATFLQELGSETFETNTTTTGSITIKQSLRNELRQRGQQALLEDLTKLYGDVADLVITKDGIILAIENEPGNFTISWELKNTIKSLDYDPFLQANAYDDNLKAKEAKREAKAEAARIREATIAAKRASKLASILGKDADPSNE